MEYKHITRKEARQAGYKRYFSGNPCTQGHVVERIVSSGKCLLCTNEYSKLYYHANKPKYQAYFVAKRVRNKDSMSIYRQNHRTNMPIAYRIGLLWKACQRHSLEEKVTLDFDRAFMGELLAAALDKGGVALETHRCDSASIDKKDKSKPISRSNIQVVPFWYNRAKNHWNEVDLVPAMARYGFVRKEAL